MGARRFFGGFATISTLAIFAARPALAQRAPREIVVHLDAAPGVTLEREDGSDTWTEVCFAPCDLAFSAHAHYRVGGGIRDSMPFTLHETSPGLEVIVVDPRSRGLHAFGDVVIGIGSALTFSGLFSIWIGAIAAHCPDGAGRGDSCGGTDNILLAPGLTIAGFGVAAIFLGVEIVVTNNKSYIHPKHVERGYDSMNRARTMLFDLSRRREGSWTPPALSGAVPIFSYHF